MASNTRQQIQDRIDHLASLVDECHCVVLVDWQTGLILCRDTDATIPQDALDALAADGLEALQSPFMSSVIALSDSLSTVSCTRHTATGITFGIQSREIGAEAIICAGKNINDRVSLERDAQELLTFLAKAEAA